MSKALFTRTAGRLIAPLLLAALTLGSGSAYAEGDAAAGKTAAGGCAGCHGSDGKGTLPINPNLGGQHEGYLAKQLHDFQSGARVNPTMAAMAASLSEQDIENIAAFYASQEVAKGVSNEEGLTQGEDIYRGGIAGANVPACSGCHGATGMGNPAADFPALSGQSAEYVALQLKGFRSKERANDPNAMMRAVAERLTDAEIDAVSNYIQGLH